MPTLEVVTTLAPTAARLDRGYVEVSGPDAEDFLERMLSNEVKTLKLGPEARPALLLTPKGRIVAPLRVVRETSDAFLLITEGELADVVARTLQRSKLAARCEIEVLPWEGYVLFGTDLGYGATRNFDYGLEGFEIWGPRGDEHHHALISEDELERMRVEAGTPRWGRELDDSILPAEAGLDRTHISFTKGCYPGQEPIARLHHRGHANRGLRVLELDGAAAPGAEVRLGDKAVGRVTSVAGALALAYVRTEVPEEAELEVGDGRARAKKMPSR